MNYKSLERQRKYYSNIQAPIKVPPPQENKGKDLLQQMMQKDAS